MSWGLIYYLVSLLAGFTNLFGITMIISAVGAILSLIIYIISSAQQEEGDKKAHKIAKKVFKIAISTLIGAIVLSALIPSKKDALIILGLNAAETTAGEEIKALPPKLLKLINQELDNLIDEKKESK